MQSQQRAWGRGRHCCAANLDGARTGVSLLYTVSTWDALAGFCPCEVM